MWQFPASFDIIPVSIQQGSIDSFGPSLLNDTVEAHPGFESDYEGLRRVIGGNEAFSVVEMIILCEV